MSTFFANKISTITFFVMLCKKKCMCAHLFSQITQSLGNYTLCKNKLIIDNKNIIKQKRKNSFKSFSNLFHNLTIFLNIYCLKLFFIYWSICSHFLHAFGIFSGTKQNCPRYKRESFVSYFMK